LADYIVLLGIFISIKKFCVFIENAGKAAKVAVKTIQYPLLLIIAALYCAIGAVGMDYL
jgi:hypothetical protein